MGNEQSSPVLRLKNGKGKSSHIVILTNGMEPTPTKTPLYCKKAPRGCGQRTPSRTSLTGSVAPPSLPNSDGTPARQRSNTINLLSPQPGADRRRSRSLCSQQIQQDTTAISTKDGKDEASPRKGSNGMVQSLTRLRIQQSFKAARPTIGDSILRKAASSRSDVRQFLARLPEETMNDLCRDMYQLLSIAVESIERSDKVLSAASRFGENFALLVNYGFRPEFFSGFADAAIAECVRLDGGTHKRCETLLAWSQLVSAIFTSVRDGYYSRVRFQRRASLPQNRITRQISVDFGNSKSVDEEEEE